MKRTGASFLSLAVLLAAGCATTQTPQPEPQSYRTTDDGKVIWLEEFEFHRPPQPWKLVQVADGGEFSLAFIKADDCPFPCQSAFAYDEEPFGYSMNLEGRMDEFFQRFLWATHLTFERLSTTPTQVLGGEGLEAIAEGKDPVKGEKVWAKVVFGRRGERVVSFYLTQWRGMAEDYDPQVVKDFDQFVASFRFLKPSFYDTL